MSTDADLLADALRAAPPRDAQVLLRAAADRAGLAAFYGVEAPAAEVLVSAALASVHEHLVGRVPATELLPRLSAALPEVKRTLAAREAAWEASPAAARETLLRRVAVVAIVAVTAWFFAHRP